VPGGPTTGGPAWPATLPDDLCPKPPGGTRRSGRSSSSWTRAGWGGRPVGRPMRSLKAGG